MPFIIVGSFYLSDPVGQRQPAENYHRDFVDCTQVSSSFMCRQRHAMSNRSFFSALRQTKD
jgi:hypothetical protein